MSKFYESLAAFEHAINSYAEAPALKEVVLKSNSFEKIKFVVRRELEMSGHANPSGDAFGFDHLNSSKNYFTCRGIRFIKETN